MSFSIIPSSISSRLLRPRESRSLAIVVSCREEVITAAAAYCWDMDRALRRDGNPPRRPAQPAPAGDNSAWGQRPMRSSIRTAGQPRRSEEHTSELQSLMRISYAVFCLKKKTKKNTKRINIQTSSYKYNKQRGTQ